MISMNLRSAPALRGVRPPLPRAPVVPFGVADDFDGEIRISFRLGSWWYSRMVTLKLSSSIARNSRRVISADGARAQVQ